MNPDHVAEAIKGIPSLRAAVVIAMPDCLLFGSWLESNSSWDEDTMAGFFGDLFRANREGLKAIDSWSAEMQVTLDSPEHWILIEEITPDFVSAAVFERSAPLGVVRLYAKQLNDRIRPTLPSFESEKRPRGVRVFDFLDRYAPDPHAVLLRVSLQTRISTQDLESPQSLTDKQVAEVERAACNILGIESMNI